MKIVVIGGTGLIGSKTVAQLQQRGHEAVAAAPNTGVNTITGDGLAAALAGAVVVIDVSNSPSLGEKEAMDFFGTSARNIAAAERTAGVGHHVALSVVGTDRLQDSGYFRAKLAQERMIADAGIPYSLVHATQFFEFIRSIAQTSTVGDEVHVPPVAFQPMAADDVASAIVEVALGEPVNGLIEIAGPETFTMDEAVGRVLAFDRDPRTIVADPAAPYFGVQVDDRSLVPGPGARLGTTRLDWWIEHVPPPPRMAPVTAAMESAH